MAVVTASSSTWWVGEHRNVEPKSSGKAILKKENDSMSRHLTEKSFGRRSGSDVDFFQARGTELWRPWKAPLFPKTAEL